MGAHSQLSELTAVEPESRKHTKRSPAYPHHTSHYTMAATAGPLSVLLAKSAVQLRAGMSAEVLSALDSDSKNLKDTYSLTPVAVGATAPDFTLSNATKTSVSLSSLLKENKAVVLSWYRGAWCPYCNIALHSLSKMVPELTELGAKLVALTPETPDEAMSLKEKKQLPFEVLSDDGCEVALKYGV